MSYKHQYVIPLDQLQEMNPDSPVKAEWAADVVTMEEANPTSTKQVGENIIDVITVDRETAHAFVKMDSPQYGNLTDDLIDLMIDGWKR